MASRNIHNEIICKHSKDCSSYSVWVGDGKSSKCKHCKNNQYKDPQSLKNDYYKADTPTKIVNVITTILVLGILIWFGYWLCQTPIS